MNRSIRLMSRLGALAAGLAMPAMSTAATVLIDFGSAGQATGVDAVGRTWNNVFDSNDTAGEDNSGSFALENTAGQASDYVLSITNPSPGTGGFDGVNTQSFSVSGDAAARDYPASAATDFLFGNGTDRIVRLVLSGLNPAETYSLDFLSARNASGNRTTQFTVTGGNGTSSTSINSVNNTGTLVGVSGVTPDGQNHITIDIARGSGNDSTFTYLNTLEINSVPEPASTLALAGPVLLLSRRRAFPR